MKSLEPTIRTLRCIITEILLLERAPTKDTWENHILGFLTGAIREFYKARLGEKNKVAVQQDIDHWYKEVNGLIQGALGVYDQLTKKKTIASILITGFLVIATTKNVNARCAVGWDVPPVNPPCCIPTAKYPCPSNVKRCPGY